MFAVDLRLALDLVVRLAFQTVVLLLPLSEAVGAAVKDVVCRGLWEEEDQEDAPEEDRGPIKRQKLNSMASEEKTFESRLTAGGKPHVLRQATLNFDKVSKSRRLFSRKELNQKGVLDREEEVEED